MDSFVAYPAEEKITEAVEFVENKATEYGASLKLISRLNIAVDEIFCNVARYSGAKTVVVTLDKTDTDLILTFADDGKPFDPTAVEDPDVSLGAADRAVGGLGIFMVKKFTREMTYERKDEQNVFKMIFAL